MHRGGALLLLVEQVGERAELRGRRRGRAAGGLECKGRELGDSSIQLLFASFKSEYSVTLDYVVSDYNDKQYRCITGFTVAKS